MIYNYKANIINFNKEIEKLRSYVDEVTNQLLEKRDKNGIREKNSIPIRLEYNKNLPNDSKYKIDKTEVEKLEDKYGRTIEFNYNENTKRYAIDWIDEKERLKCLNARRKEIDSFFKKMKLSEHEALTLEMSFVRLISEVENFFTNIVKTHFINKPEYYKNGEKAKTLRFNLEDIIAFNEEKDAKEKDAILLLVELDLRNKMSNGFDGWIDYLKEPKGPFSKINIKSIEKLLPELKEAYQRRNILTHDKGQVNSIYLSKYPNDHPNDPPKLGSKIRLDGAYVEDAISNFQIFFNIIGTEIWRLGAKDKNSNSDRGDLIIQYQYECLEIGNYSNSIIYGNYLESDPNVSSKNINFAKINSYLAKKNNSGLEAIKGELENEDVGGLDILYKMAYSLLGEKYDNTFEEIEKLLKRDVENETNRNKLIDTGIFEKTRKNRKELDKEIKKKQSKKLEITEDIKRLEEDLKINEEDAIKNSAKMDDIWTWNPSIGIRDLITWPLFENFRKARSEDFNKLVNKYKNKKQ